MEPMRETKTVLQRKLRRPKVVVVPGRLTDEMAVEKCDELIQFAERFGEIDEPTVRKLREARRAAYERKMSRLQAHLLTTVERAIKTSVRWKLYRVKELCGEEAKSPEIQGEGVSVDGVKWKNPASFKKRFEFWCPRAVGEKKKVTLERCEEQGCNCFGMLRAKMILARIYEKIEEEGQDSFSA